MLIVTSKAKKHVKEKSEFNTSMDACNLLSEHCKVVLDKSIEFAKKDGRKTVMGRDIERVIKTGEANV